MALQMNSGDSCNLINELEQGYCFICSKAFVLANFFVAETSSVWPPQEPGYLSNDLYVYFLMRHCFEVSPGKLEKYLKNYPHPEKWVRICSSCHTSYVEECATLFFKLVQIQREFREAKRKLSEAIKERDMKSLRKGDEAVLDIVNETICFLKRHFCGGSWNQCENDYLEEEENLKDISCMESRVSKSAGPEIPVKRKRGRSPKKNVHSQSGFAGFSVKTKENTNRRRGRPRKNPQPTATAEQSTTNFPLSAVIKEEPVDISEDNCLLGHASDLDYFHEPSPLSTQDQDGDDNSFVEASPPPSPLESKLFDGHPPVEVNDNDEHVSSSEEPNHILRRRKQETAYFQDGPDLRCIKCLKQFRHKDSARRHYLVIHQNASKYSCTHCGRKFGLKSCYNQHLSKLHGIMEKNSYNCNFPKCGRGFANKILLERHEVLHYPPSLKCNICDRLFRHKKTLLTHLHCHKNKGQVKSGGLCQWAVVRTPEVKVTILPEKGSGSLSDLEQDEEASNEVGQDCGPRTCRTCGKEFEGIKCLRRHYRLEHSRKESFTCHLCTKSFSTRYRYFRHLQQVHNVTDRLIHPCPAEGCDKRFSEKTKLDNHFKIHQPPSLNCPKCPKVFRFDYHLKKHLRYHNDSQVSKTLPCPYCSAVYNAPDDLQQHVKIKHDDLPPEELAKFTRKKYTKLKCVTCNKDFTEKYKYHRHLAQVHKSMEHCKFFCQIESCKGIGFAEKTAYDRHMDIHLGPHHACHYCERIFKKPEKLKRHILQHEDRIQKNFVCDQCPRRYSQKSALNKHIRLKHPESLGIPEQKYFCPECGEEKADKRALDCHIYRVHRKKPMCCEVCGKMIMSGYMRVHMESMHSDCRVTKPYKCDICGKGFSRRKAVREHKKTHFPKNKPRIQRHRATTKGDGNPTEIYAT